MASRSRILDRSLHWISAVLLLLMLMTLSSQLHQVNWEVKGQLAHRQDAVELHAIMGLMLVVVMLIRLIFPLLSSVPMVRMQPTSATHGFFIRLTHSALYVSILGLAVTGLMMVNNYEIPLMVAGISIAQDKQAFYANFTQWHEIHMILKQVMWWLIGLHLAGVLYAKK